MASFRRALQTVLHHSNSSYLNSRRLLTYTAHYYDGQRDPGPIFITQEVQDLLQSLARVDYEKVFRRRKVGSKKLSDPEYKFMTDSELQRALSEAKEKADELMQIPPVVKVRNTETTVLSEEPELRGLESCRMVFTDITFGIPDSERIVVVREPDGTLQEAEWVLRQRMNQTYFPVKGKLIKQPRMFMDNYFESLLDRHEYEYILDRACLQYDPDDPEYQRIASIVYQHLNDRNKFQLLRSTRHFGALTFFLVWHRNIDNLLLDIIETLRIDEAGDLVSLYSLVHEVGFEGRDALARVQDYVKQAAGKKGALELALQAFKEVTAQNEALARGIQSSHGQ